MSKCGKSIGMSFSDAIPLNRISDSETRYNSSMKREGAGGGWSRENKQTVNISKKTAMKTAHSKLSSALMHKIAYDNAGQFGTSASVGQLFDVKA